MRKYIKKFENLNDKIDILFLPSGEIIQISFEEFDILSDYVILEYNSEYKSYTIEDYYRDVIMMALQK